MTGLSQNEQRYHLDKKTGWTCRLFHWPTTTGDSPASFRCWKSLSSTAIRLMLDTAGYRRHASVSSCNKERGGQVGWVWVVDGMSGCSSLDRVSLTSAHMLRCTNSEGISTAMLRAWPRLTRSSRAPGSLLSYFFPAETISEMIEETDGGPIFLSSRGPEVGGGRERGGRTWDERLCTGGCVFLCLLRPDFISLEGQERGAADFEKGRWMAE